MSVVRSRRRAVRALALPLLAVPAAHAAPGPGPAGSLAAALAGLSSPDAVVFLPAGEHHFDNPLVVRRRSGTLRLLSGAWLLPRRAVGGGLRFDDCTDLAIEGLRIEWPQADGVARSHHGAGLMLVTSARVAVRDCVIVGAPGAGLHVDTCTQVLVERVRVARTLADGVHFANCREVVARDLHTRDTGDDGVGCVDYAHAPAGGGISLRGVDVEGSRARGIAIAGASDVDIDGFTVRRTASSGVLVATDVHYRTRRPARVALRDGAVEGGGRMDPGAGNRFGIEVIAADDVALHDVRVTGARSRGVSVVDTGGAASLSDVDIGAPDAPDGAALECRGNARVTIRRARLDGSAGPALDVVANARLELDAIVLHGAAGVEAGARIDGPGRVVIGEVRVEDDGVARLRVGGGARGSLRVPDRRRVALELRDAEIELLTASGGNDG
jgi:hypothetical protein